MLRHRLGEVSKSYDELGLTVNNSLVDCHGRRMVAAEVVLQELRTVQ